MPSVSAAVFRDGEVLWERALGLADVEARQEATPQTQYRIGSITKTFTAVGILQLRDAGELSLDDPLTKHLPESAHAPTLGRMLAHSSGLQREPPGEIWETMKAPSREELIDGTADAEQVLDPGTRWHYSNLAFVLLGEVVARATAARRRKRCRSGSSGRSGCRGRRPTRPNAPRAATSSSRTGTPSSSSRARPRRRRRARQALDHHRRPRALGAFLASGHEDVSRASTLEEMAHVRAMVDHAGWTLAWGTGLELDRRGEHVFVGHGGAMPGHLAGLVVDRKTRSAHGAHEYRFGCRAGEARARPRDGRDRCATGGDGSVAGRRGCTRRARTVAWPMVDRRPSDRPLVA